MNPRINPRQILIYFQKATKNCVIFVYPENSPDLTMQFISYGWKSNVAQFRIGRNLYCEYNQFFCDEYFYSGHLPTLTSGGRNIKHAKFLS